MMYTLDLIVVSIGIIEFFQLVSILTFFCILIYFHVYMLAFQRVSISIGIYFSYIYMFLFVPTIFLYIRAQDIAKVENLNDYPISIDYF